MQVEVVFAESETAVTGLHQPPFVGVVEHRSQSLAPISMGLATGADASFSPQDSLESGRADAMDIDGITDPNGVDAKQSPNELLSGMRDHYLQALYVSKVRTLLIWLRILASYFVIPDIRGLLCQRSFDALPKCFSILWL